MKNLLILIFVFVLFGCESINTKQAASNATKYADFKSADSPCFIIDKNLSKHSTIITTPEFMDNSYGFFVENHFKKDKTIVLDIGQMLEKDLYASAKEMFANQCFIGSISELPEQSNVIIKVDLVSSKISAPKSYQDNIVTQLGVLYSFYDRTGQELFKAEVIEEDSQKASSTAAYRSVANKTVDKVIASSNALIWQSLQKIH